MSEYHRTSTSDRRIPRWARAGAAAALSVAALAAVDLVGAPTGAQDATPVVTDIVVEGATVNGEQAISDDGRVVVFESTAQVGGQPFTRVLVHDLDRGVTVAVPESKGGTRQTFNPAISGSGCIVTYSTFTPAVFADPAPAADDGDAAPGVTTAPDPATEEPAAEPVLQTPATSELRALDRCGAAAPSVLVATVETDQPLPAAAASTDGVFIAYANGDEIIRMQGTFDGYSISSVFDASTVPSPPVVTGDDLDISGDGSTIVFEAGVDAAPDDPTNPVAFDVYAWTIGEAPTPPSVRRVASLSSSPSVSADGRVIAFESAVGSDSAFTGVVAQVLSAEGPAVNISIDPGGRLPDVSADGHHIVYNTSTGRPAPGVAMTSSVVDGTFGGVTVSDLSAAVNGAAAIGVAVSGPRVSALGDAVAVDPDRADGTARTVSVRSIASSIALDAAAHDLGTGDRGEVLSATVVVTNQGPSSLRLGSDAIVLDSPFLVGSTTCDGAVGPRATCTIEVTVKIDQLEDVFGTLTVTPPSGAAVSSQLTALGVASTTSLGEASTGTTSPPNTTNTTPVTTTRTTVRNTTPRTTTRITVRVTTTRVTVPEIDLDPTFEPSTFDFAPTIIDAGRRTASVQLVNVGSSTETLTSAAFDDPDAGFSVAETDCSTLTVGARCTLDLVFAPTAAGDLAVDLVAEFASGATVRLPVTGVAAPAPVLEVIPGVATVGQVVTVQGSGFPAAATVKLRFDDGIVQRDVVVNDSGVFNVPLVVLPNTHAGPLLVEVEGQDDLFGDVGTEMLVTRTTGRTSPGVLGSFGANLGV